MTHFRPVLLACSLLALACDKPSSDPDAPTGGGVGGGEGGGASAGAEGGGAGVHPPVDVTRTLVVAKDHEFYTRLEGSEFANDCKEDTSCKTGGCSGEVCSAEEGVITDCEVIHAQLPPDASCGCVESQCVWWSPSGATLAGGGGDATPSKPDGASTEKPTPNGGDAPSGTAVACGTQTCKPGEECIGYYGIAGPKGPKFESCEVRCGKDGSCPKAMKCVTVADGPGRVCR